MNAVAAAIVIWLLVLPGTMRRVARKARAGLQRGTSKRHTYYENGPVA